MARRRGDIKRLSSRESKIAPPTLQNVLGRIDNPPANIVDGVVGNLIAIGGNSSERHFYLTRKFVGAAGTAIALDGIHGPGRAVVATTS